jgi:hypothetical protein
MDTVATNRALPLSATVLRNLSDKAYDKRKSAALEIEAKVKVLALFVAENCSLMYPLLHSGCCVSRTLDKAFFGSRHHFYGLLMRCGRLFGIASCTDACTQTVSWFEKLFIILFCIFVMRRSS